jgi:recombination protein RecR
VTKLGQGISIGSSVEDLEDGTLLSAFKNRTEIKNNSD